MNNVFCTLYVQVCLALASGSYVEESSSVQLAHIGVNTFAGYSVSGTQLWLADESSSLSTSQSCQYNSGSQEFVVSSTLPIDKVEDGHRRQSSTHGSFTFQCGDEVDIHSVGNHQQGHQCSIYSHFSRKEDIPHDIEYSFAIKHVYVGLNIQTGAVLYKTTQYLDTRDIPGVVWIHSKIYLVQLSNGSGEQVNRACWARTNIAYQPLPDYITSFTESDGQVEVQLSPICAEVALQTEKETGTATTIGVHLLCSNLQENLMFQSLTRAFNAAMNKSHRVAQKKSIWYVEGHDCTQELEEQLPNTVLPSYSMSICSRSVCHKQIPKVSWTQKVHLDNGEMYNKCNRNVQTSSIAQTQQTTLAVNVKTESQRIVSNQQSDGFGDGPGSEFGLVVVNEGSNKTLSLAVNHLLPTPNTSILHAWSLEQDSNICDACMPLVNTTRRAVASRAPFSYQVPSNLEYTNNTVVQHQVSTTLDTYEHSKQLSCQDYESQYQKGLHQCLNSSLKIRYHTNSGRLLLQFEAENDLVYTLDPLSAMEEEFNRIHSMFCSCLCTCTAVCNGELTCMHTCSQDCSKTREVIKVVFQHERSRLTTESVYVMTKRMLDEFGSTKAQAYPTSKMLIELEHVFETFLQEEGNKLVKHTFHNDYVLFLVILTACFVVYRLRTSIQSYQVVASSVTVEITSIVCKHPARGQNVCRGMLDSVEVITKIIRKTPHSTRKAETQVSVLWLQRDTRGVSHLLTSQEDNHHIYLAFQPAQTNQPALFYSKTPCVYLQQAAEYEYNAHLVRSVVSKLKKKLHTVTLGLEPSKRVDQRILQTIAKHCNIVRVFLHPSTLQPIQRTKKPSKLERLGHRLKTKLKTKFPSTQKFLSKKQAVSGKVDVLQGTVSQYSLQKHAKGFVHKRMRWSEKQCIFDNPSRWLTLPPKSSTRNNKNGLEMVMLRNFMSDIASGLAVLHVQLRATHNAITPSHVLVNLSPQPNASLCGWSEVHVANQHNQRQYTHTDDGLPGPTVTMDTESLNILSLSNEELYCSAPETVLALLRHNEYKLQCMAVQRSFQTNKTVPSHAAPPQKSQAADIYAQGVLFFYMYTQGQYPFEPLAPVRVQKKPSSFSQYIVLYIHEQHKLVENRVVTTKAQHALSYPRHEILLFEHQFHQCTQIQPVQRVSIKGVLNHPFFWSDGKRAKFLISVSNLTQIQWSSVYYTFLVDMLEKLSAQTVQSTWMDGIPLTTMAQLCLGRSYRLESLVDVLRLFRNKEGHYRELSAEESLLLGSTTESRMNFFLARIPQLLQNVYLATSTVVEFVMEEQKDSIMDCNLAPFAVKLDDAKIRVRKRIRGKGGKKAIQEEGQESMNSCKIDQDKQNVKTEFGSTILDEDVESTINNTDIVITEDTTTNVLLPPCINARTNTTPIHLYTPKFQTLNTAPQNYTNLLHLVQPTQIQTRLPPKAFFLLLLLQKHTQGIEVHDEELARFYSGLTCFNLNVLHADAQDLISPNK